MIIREYEPSDHEAVIELHNRGLLHAGVHLGEGPWDEDLERIPETYSENLGAFLVGYIGSRLVAMGAFKHTDLDRAEIKRMRVEPSLHRRGLGQAIFMALENRAIELGYGILHLDTTQLQVAARGLYERNGFVEVGRGQDANFEYVLYEKRLGI